MKKSYIGGSKEALDLAARYGLSSRQVLCDVDETDTQITFRIITNLPWLHIASESETISLTFDKMEDK